MKSMQKSLLPVHENTTICNAVIDTNVLVSAVLKWESLPGHIMQLAFCGTIRPLLNETIRYEYHEVLLRPKFHLTEELVHDILRGMEAHAVFVDAPTLDIDLPDPKDHVFYDVLMAARQHRHSVLVTGNMKHFPKAPYILTPRELLLPLNICRP